MTEQKPAMIGYARVSTLDQSPEMQISALESAGCTRIYHEQASSRKERPELLKALEYMRGGDTLVVWKLDRLARSTKELLETVENLAQRNINFRCLTQDIDTATAGGRLVFTIFAAFAEFERELIRERTNAGLKAAIARGRRGGRPKAFDPVRDADKIAMANALLADPALSPKAIAKQLGVSKSALYRNFAGGKTAAMLAKAEQEGKK